MTNTLLKPQVKLQAQFATSRRDVLACQRLRYQIFSEEQGAVLPYANEKIDQDHYDNYCQHLLVRNTDTHEVVGYTRILTHTHAKSAGSFYSENEFCLDHLLPLRGNVIEIGRTCIHPDYRTGIGITTLWQGLFKFITLHQIDYLFGCASIPMDDNGQQLANIMAHIDKKQYVAPRHFKVAPRLPIITSNKTSHTLNLPPLLKMYFKLGAWVVGDPCFDPDFNVADLFILADSKNLNQRYQRYFGRHTTPQKVANV